MDQLTFSQTIDSFMLACYARRLSPNTIRDYTFTFRRFQGFLKEDPPFALITPHQVESFLASLPVSKKTVLNYHTGLSALWTWAVKESIATEHILHRVSRPKPEKKEIKPYSQTEIKDMLAALTHSNFYTRPGHPPWSGLSLRRPERQLPPAHPGRRSTCPSPTLRGCLPTSSSSR